jgi:tryptophan-rich sensory protein
VTIAYAGARALTRAQSRDHSQLAGGLILDLALNAAWTPLFFRARRPRAALAEIACLNIANVLLISARHGGLTARRRSCCCPTPAGPCSPPP